MKVKESPEIALQGACITVAHPWNSACAHMQQQSATSLASQLAWGYNFCARVVTHIYTFIAIQAVRVTCVLRVMNLFRSTICRPSGIALSESDATHEMPDPPQDICVGVICCRIVDTLRGFQRQAYPRQGLSIGDVGVIPENGNF